MTFGAKNLTLLEELMSNTEPTPSELHEGTAELYFFLERNFTEITATCQTPEQKEKVADLNQCARKAFLKAKRAGLQGNNLIVAEIYRDLKATTKTVQDAHQQLTDIEEFLRLATEAVRLAGAIATFGAAA